MFFSVISWAARRYDNYEGVDDYLPPGPNDDMMYRPDIILLPGFFLVAALLVVAIVIGKRGRRG